MTIYRHHHCCPSCGYVECEELTITGKPLSGQFRGQEIQIPVDGNVILIGYGPKLRDRVDADWVKTTPLLEGVIYAYSVVEGVVEIPARSLKQLAGKLGSAFVKVEQGVMVALAACLLPRIKDRMVGLQADVVNGTRIIHWVRCSRDGAKRLAESLRRRVKPTPPTPLQSAHEVVLTS